MKLTSTLLASALLTASASFAMADTIGSYGDTATKPAGYTNTALTYTGSNTTGPVAVNSPTASAGPTYNIPTGGVWFGPVGSSSWVGINRGDYPGGGNVEPNNTFFTYYTTFTGGANNTLNLDVLADDTTWVYLNGVNIVTPNDLRGAQHCIAGRPTCTFEDLISVGGVNAGLNYLSFSTEQMFGSASGLDFEATTGVTPEPSSLLLLGSGLSTMAGLAFRRRRQA